MAPTLIASITTASVVSAAAGLPPPPASAPSSALGPPSASAAALPPPPLKGQTPLPPAVHVGGGSLPSPTNHDGKPVGLAPPPRKPRSSRPAESGPTGIPALKIPPLNVPPAEAPGQPPVPTDGPASSRPPLPSFTPNEIASGVRMGTPAIGQRLVVPAEQTSPVDAALAKLSRIRESVRPAAQAVWATTGRVGGALRDSVRPENRQKAATAVHDLAQNVTARTRDLYALARANPTDPRVLKAGGATLLLGLLVVGGIALAARSRGGGNHEAAPNTEPQTQPETSAAPARPLSACKAARPALRIAPKVNKDIPLELAVAPDGNRTFIGFAIDSKTPRGVAIDRITSKITEIPPGTAAEAVTAVAPTLVKGEATLLVTTEKSGEPLRGARQLSLEPLTLVGQSEHGLGLVAKPAGSVEALWPLDGTEPVEALRVLEVPEEGYALTFRRRGAIWLGWLDPSRKPKGSLARVPDVGGPPDSGIGSPAIAHNGLGVAIAFADRSAKTEPWAVYVAAAVGTQPPASVRKFVVPAGGPGGDAFAPRIAGAGAGSSLLVWTEGALAAHDHDVRVQMIGRDFETVGKPFTVSRPQTNAGQGAIAIRAGKGIVAYLELSPDGYEMWGVPIECE